MSDKKNIIAFMGLKTCGKDYQSQAYINIGYKKIALADPLREVAWNILGYNPEEKGNIPYNDFKNCNLSAEVEHKFMGVLPYYTDVKITSIRKILQNIGTEFKRLFGTDYWCNLWYDSVVKSGENVVLTDLRFPNEVKKVLELKDVGYNVTFRWCQYEKADYDKILADKHESELLNQFIYYNRDKYKLHDSCIIKEDVLKRILEDFEKTKKFSF